MQRGCIVKGLAFALAILISAEGRSVYAQDKRPKAQDNRPKIVGEIKLEEAQRKKDPYQDAQDRTIDYFKNLNALVQNLARGGSGQIEVFDEKKSQPILDYLTSLYLYCTVQKGACPLVLDAVLELDVINARLNGGSECPNLHAFWKRWGENGFEERLKYHISTGRLEPFTAFMKKERPRYLQCSETVAAEIKGPLANSAYFAARYAGGSQQAANVSKMLRLLELTKEKKLNLFIIAQNPSGSN